MYDQQGPMGRRYGITAFVVMAELGVRLSAGGAEGHADTVAVAEQGIEEWLDRRFAAGQIGGGGTDDLADIGGNSASFGLLLADFAIEFVEHSDNDRADAVMVQAGALIAGVGN
jgi:hypothetical protein